MSSQEPDDSGLNTPVDVPPPEPAASDGRPGAQLLAERRAQGLSLGDVARQLKLSVRQVEALERDEYAAFPGPVFVRGFLRNYAKLLQLDPEALVAQAAIAAGPVSAAAASVPPTPVPLQESRSRRSRFGFGTLTLGLVLLIVVAAAIYDARNKPAPVSLGPASSVPGAPAHSPQHADSPPPSAPGTSGAPAAVAPGAAVAPTATVATAAPDATTAAAPAAATTPPPESAAATPAPAATPPAPAPSAPPGVAEIKLNFDDESWVEIKDGTGAVIFSRLNPAGAEQVVTGRAPLDVVIGNAHSVRLSYRNKPVDLAPHTRVDVARVRLE